jgi:hypothetical protein
MDSSIPASDSRTRRADPFFFAFAVTLLAIVIVGFAPSLFMRFAFDPPPMPFYLHLHGVILTGWFVLLVMQAWLIRVDNPALHRKLGYFAAAYGAAVVVGGLMASLNVVSRELGSGVTFDMDMADIDPALGVGITFLTFVSGVIWSNIASVSGFAVLLAAAVYFRRRPDVHKRLILVATVGIMGPPLARISRLEILGGEQGPFIPLALLALAAAILVHDKLALGKLHRASLAAIIFTIALKFLGGYMASSELGQAFVTGLAPV